MWIPIPEKTVFILKQGPGIRLKISWGLGALGLGYEINNHVEIAAEMSCHISEPSDYSEPKYRTSRFCEIVQ